MNFAFVQRILFFVFSGGLFEAGKSNYLLQAYKTMSSGASKVYAQRKKGQPCGYGDYLGILSSSLRLRWAFPFLVLFF